MIYKAADASFNPDTDMVGDFCYWNIPPVDSADFTIARKLLNEARIHIYRNKQKLRCRLYLSYGLHLFCGIEKAHFHTLEYKHRGCVFQALKV